MLKYNFKKIKEHIEFHKKDIAEASIGMIEDWYYTAKTVYKNDKYLIDLDEKDLKIEGIDRSYWATPTIEFIFNNGLVQTIPCYEKLNEDQSNKTVEEEKKVENEIS